MDSAGNIYISNLSDPRVRKVNAASGIITTVAGTGTEGYNGDNIQAASAELNYPFGLAVDSAGDLYIADQTNERIRMVNAGGIITTVAGDGTGGYNGDGIPALSADLSQPLGVVLDSTGNLYIADTYNYRVRKVTAPEFTAPYGFFANSNTCSSTGSASPVSLSGGIKIDGYNSASGGTYSSTEMKSLGIVGSNGSVVLSGGANVGGTVYVQQTALNGKCPASDLHVSGGATYGSAVGISAYNPAVPSIPAAGTANVSLSRATKQTLAPGSYNSITAGGGSSLTLTAPGIFNINCLQLTGGSTLTISPATEKVVLNVAGTSCSGNAAVDFSGGTVSNPSGIAGNLLINYAGTQAIKLSGGADAYITVNAPNAAISLGGGTDFFGAIVGSTISVSGGVQLHFDSALQ